MNSTVNTINKDVNAIILFALAILGITTTFSLCAVGKLNSTIAISIYLLMTISCAIVIAQEQITEGSDAFTVVQNFVAAVIGWFFYVPIYLFSKKTETYKNYGVVYGFLGLIMVIGNGEIFRLNFTNDSKFDPSYGMSWVALVIAFFIMTPAIIAKIVKSESLKLILMQSILTITGLLIFNSPHNAWVILNLLIPVVLYSIYLASQNSSIKQP